VRRPDVPRMRWRYERVFVALVEVGLVVAAVLLLLDV
jgi:hypothetical protein